MQNNDENESKTIPTYFTINQVSTKLQVSEATVRRWIRQGLLHATWLGSKYRISQHDLQVFLKERRK